MVARGLSVTAVALAGVGAVAVYAGTKGVGLGSGLRSILGAQPIQGGDPTLGAIPAGDSAIAAAAAQYVGGGHVYRFGGASPATGWDCSGFVNYVLCHDLGADIPGYAGGTFTGAVHGPVTGQWAIWSGAFTITRSEVQSGDLVVWPLQHMGIALDNQSMINCPGPNGTPAPVVGTIDGAAPGPLVCRRISGVAAGASGGRHVH